jgi:hypothetical protein
MLLLQILHDLFITLAHAQGGGDVDTAFDEFCGILHGDDCGASPYFLANLSIRITMFLAGLIGAAAVLAIMWGGIKLMTSAGNDQGKEDAKKIIQTAIIGLILAIAAEAILLFVRNMIMTIVP